MAAADLPAVMAVADIVHPTLPERIEVFAEKLALFARGSLVLEEPRAGGVIGYVVSHPCRRWSTSPARRTSSRCRAEGYARRYPRSRAAAGGAGAWRGVGGRGPAAGGGGGGWREERLAVSVYHSAPFWRRHGFRDATPGMLPAAEAEKLPRVYGAEAVYTQRAL